MITLDTTGAIVLTASGEIDTILALPSDLTVPPAGTSDVLAIVRCSYGQTEIQEGPTNFDILDLRFTYFGTSGGSTSFTDLSDTFASYSGLGGQYVKVKADASGLETGTPSGGSAMEPTIAAPGYDGSLTLLSGVVTIVDDSKYNAFPSLVKLSNGNLAVFYRQAASHAFASDGIVLMRTSADGGDTWSSASTVAGTISNYDTGGGGAITLASGRVLVVVSRNTISPAAHAVDGVYTTYSDNNGSTWSALNQINSAFSAWSAAFTTPIQLPDGTVRIAIYGQNTGDTYSSISIFTSNDDGATWTGEVVIADGQAAGRDWQEPNLVWLHDGRILCVIRSDHPLGTPDLIYQCYSSDQGATWTAPAMLWLGTGAPRTIQLKNGLLLYISRRKSDELGIYRVSRDNGYSWSAEADFDTSYLLMYASACEYKEGLIGVAYGLHVSDPDSNVVFKRFYLTTEGGQLVSNVPTGTPPLAIQSTTLITNLNADLLDGKHASDFVAVGSPSTGKYRQFLYTVIGGNPTFLTDNDGYILTVPLDLE
jgi:hypothetical protein